jgi:hypothetical protein
MKFKTEQVEKRFSNIHLTLVAMCRAMDEYCDLHGMEFMLTETRTTPEEDKALGRVSTSHAEGRAVDIRTKDWPEAFRTRFIETFTIRFGGMGAYSKDGKRNFLVYHDSGHGAHIHAQLDKTFSIKGTI